MKLTSPQIKSKPAIKKSILWPILAALVLVGIGVWVWNIVLVGNANRAVEAAAPLESSLVKSGAVKQCSRSDSGRGPDNNRPWYDAIYQIPTTRDGALAFLNQAAEQNGFHLTNSTTPANPGDNKFYGDTTSKHSTYTDLQDGNIEVAVTVFGSSTYTGDSLCTVTKTANAPSSFTTVLLTVNLPRVK